MKEAIHTDRAPAAIGPYSQAVRAGGFLFTSGQIPVDPAAGDIPAGIKAQAQQSLNNIAAILAQAGLEMVDTENLRPHYARTLWSWSDALEAQLTQAAQILQQQVAPERADKALRAYRLYLAGCAMGFERGWMALYQMLVTHPDGDLRQGKLRGAQSAYPFQRDYMYR